MRGLEAWETDDNDTRTEHRGFDLYCHQFYERPQRDLSLTREIPAWSAGEGRPGDHGGFKQGAWAWYLVEANITLVPLSRRKLRSGSSSARR